MAGLGAVSSVDRDDDGRVAVFPSWLPSAAEAEVTAGGGEAGAAAGGAGERGQGGLTAVDIILSADDAR